MRGDSSITVTCPSATAQYRATEEADGETSQRLRALEGKASLNGLTTEETLEQLALERQQASMAPRLERLRREMVYEQTTMDIAAFQQAWDADVQAVREDYQRLSEALAMVQQSYQALVARHQEREQRVADLPAGVRERLAFPDGSSFATNLVARLGVDLGGLGPLNHTQLTAVMDIDGKTRAINPRMLERFLQETREWMQRQ